jgi:hypothetical protein
VPHSLVIAPPVSSGRRRPAPFGDWPAGESLGELKNLSGGGWTLQVKTVTLRTKTINSPILPNS